MKPGMEQARIQLTTLLEKSEITAGMYVRVRGEHLIAGRQEVKVNAELRELRIAGIIRESDIGVNNTIDYDKVAEARISYGGRGQISVVQTARPGQDVLEVVLPY